ncbi:hypothetical protein BOX37_31520 [Nocardia mangyaensis]|uniref:Uncharacterized protein n=1 Tax=Nocardia mangyaensis TaxID=2213200 RepID=A0A1J0W0E1_9NOCA|nr:hypothetical protein BOX37_31520 [Nocardia mangyaensis]
MRSALHRRSLRHRFAAHPLRILRPTGLDRRRLVLTLARTTRCANGLHRGGTALTDHRPRAQERSPLLLDTAGAQGGGCGRLGALSSVGEQLGSQEVQVAAQSAHAGAEVGEFAGEAGDEGGIDGCAHALIVAWMRYPRDE